MYFDKMKIYDGQRNKIKERKIQRLISNYLLGLERKRVKQRKTYRQTDRQMER